MRGRDMERGGKEGDGERKRDREGGMERRREGEKKRE
jgi:hypothetical protein